MTSYAILVFFLFLGIAMAGGAMLAGHLLSPKTPRTPFQQAAYECGNPTIGPTRVRFRAGYYLFALLFLVFDVETLLLFPAVAKNGPLPRKTFSMGEANEKRYYMEARLIVNP